MGIYLSKLRDFKYFLDCPQLTKEWEIIPASPEALLLFQARKVGLYLQTDPRDRAVYVHFTFFLSSIHVHSCFTTKHCVGLSFPELRDSSRILISGV